MLKKFAVIGNPIEQSRSPEIHQLFAKQFNHEIEYSRLLATADSFNTTVAEFIKQGATGMNVTAPFKLAAAEFATSLSERAKAANAVNTLLFRGTKVFGDNTDGIGLVKDIQENLGFKIKQSHVLILGAGGAARGILLPLLYAEPASIAIVNRTASKAIELAEQMRDFGDISAGGFDLANGNQYDLVINATSTGLSAANLPSINYSFTADSLAYDLVYSAKTTLFMQQADTAGASQTSDGLGMLVEQAAYSYKFWHGVMPDTAPVLKHLRALLINTDH